MQDYVLDSDEAVIIQCIGVHTESEGNVDLILTNKNLVQVNTSRGIFNKTRTSVKYPLSELKMLNGKANVLIGKNRHGSKQIELYFSYCERYYQFDGVFTENKWANAIIKAHKERMAELEKLQKTASGKGSILHSIAGTLESAKDKLISKKESAPKTCKCSKCGAELTGTKGQEVKCSYCDTVAIIK